MDKYSMMRMELVNIRLLLNDVEVRGERNLNNQLAAILKIKQIEKSLEEEHENHDEQGKNV